MKTGESVKIIATDPGAVSDLKTWCKANRNTYIGDEINDRVFTIWIRKGVSDE
jgi:TusA-related sulfurtransferase